MSTALSDRVIGDAWHLDLRFVLSDGTPIDMTDAGSSAVASMRRALDPSGPDVDWLIRGLSDTAPDRLIAELDPADGYFRIYLSPTTTAALSPGVYSLDVQVTYAVAWTDDPIIISTPTMTITATEGISD